MGPHRENRDQQYKYLLGLATRFQTIASFALRAYYGGDDIFDTDKSLRLATAVVDRNSVFSDDVYEKGNTMEFKNDVLDSEEDDSNDEDGESTVEHSLAVRYQDTFEQLDDLLPEDYEIVMPKVTGIKSWLEEAYKSSRGFELGTFDASLLPIIWKKQSTNWDALALGYISDIVSLVHGFTMKVLRNICPDEHIRRGLHSVLLDRLVERYRKGIDHTKWLLAVERSGTPLTVNHYFADNLEKRYVQMIKFEARLLIVSSAGYSA